MKPIHKTVSCGTTSSKRATALIIVLAFVVLLTGVALTYFSRTAGERQLAHSSYNDTLADLLARSALDIALSDLKGEIANNSIVAGTNIQPARYGVPPITDPSPIPNLIRRSFSGDPTGRTSAVSSGAASANGRFITRARWNSHYLMPRASAAPNDLIDSTPVSSFIVPDWVLVTAQGPVPAPAPGAVIGRYAFAVYDEGGLIDINVGGAPTYAGLNLPRRPARKQFTDASQGSEIVKVDCAPQFAPDHWNESGSTGTPISLGPYHATHDPTSFGANWLPHGLSIDPNNGRIYGIPASPGTFTIILSCSNGCGTGYGTLHLTINGFPSPDSTPWPVNVARKGTIGFADLTTLPSIPSVISPTTPVAQMGGFPSTAQINKIIGWRNFATTQQPTNASFDNPSFPSPAPDNYARYFLGAVLPFTTPFTTVSTAAQNGRTDQAVMTRQELIRLQRTIGFSQNLLQYLGTFSRERNHPAPDWPQLSGGLAAARWDMNNLALVIPDSWIVYPGGHGQGHAWGLQNRSLFAQRFGLVWINGNWGAQGDRFTDPNYYGHWRYIHQLNPLPADPDFFQVIDYAMNQAIGVVDPNHVRNTFNVGAALIDQYDTDDLFDPPPGQPAPPTHGNTITIIDYDGNPADYAYGIEGMSFDPPDQNLDRPPFAPYPPPVPPNYPLLNRRFENVGEFGYAYNPAAITVAKTLDFASATSHDRALLDFFTYNTASQRAGIVNLNTRNGPVLGAIIRGALLHDPGSENPATALVSLEDALAAGQAVVQETTSVALGHGPALTRADVARLAAAVAAAVPAFAGSDEAKQTIARALAEVGQTRTWNLMIDVIAQTGRYTPDAASVNQADKFVVEGEKRYWLHVALDRNDGSVLGTQLEEVTE